MYNFYQLSWKFISYWLKAFNGRGHGIHSPFVYDFVVNVLRGKHSDLPAFRKIESIRKKLRRNNESISILDLGAGSTLNKRRGAFPLSPEQQPSPPDLENCFTGWSSITRLMPYWSWGPHWGFLQGILQQQRHCMG
jgi:hypothetical protein